MPLGPWELVIILVICVIIFGAGRLSEIGGAFGKSVREFRKATSDAAPPPETTATPATPAATTTTQPVNGATTLVGNKCPSCGTLNRADQTFCGQCGTRLTVAA